MLRSVDDTAPPSRYDKRLVAQKFSKAALGYLDHAALQQQSGRALIDLIPTGQHHRVLDIGCGPGPFTETLSQRCNSYIGMDLAPNMLLEAQRRHPQSCYCGADMEYLPFASASFDLMFANLSLQWANQPSHLFHELARVSCDNGLLAISVVLPNSMQPLADIVQSLAGRARANRQATLGQYQDWLVAAGWTLDYSASVAMATRHRSPRELLDSVKGIGASLSEFRQPGLRGRSWYQQLHHALLRHRAADGTLRLHWNLGILLATKGTDKAK